MAAGADPKVVRIRCLSLDSGSGNSQRAKMDDVADEYGPVSFDKFVIFKIISI